MAKPELGTKRICAGCNLKFYDLHKTPITCPTCGAIFVEPKAPPPRPPRRPFERPVSMPVVAVAEQPVLGDDANLEDTVPESEDALVAEEEKVGDEDADAGVPVLEDMDEDARL